MNLNRLSRRSALKNIGLSALSLPILAQSTSLFADTQSPKAPKQRLVVMFSPNGTIPEHFWPKRIGEDFEHNTILKPLEPFHDKLLILRNLHNKVGGDGDSHMRGMSCLLTGIELFPGNVMGGGGTPAGWPKGISIDREICKHFQSNTETRTRFGGLHFGVGVSPWYEDFLATGERWENRGKRMDEQIDILKGLMNGEYFSYKGEFYDIPELKLCPAPTKPVPILIGGHSKPALRRAARVGDGWISAGLNIEETKELIDQINLYRVEYGTMDHPNYQFQVMGEAAYSTDGVKQLEDLGATEVIVAFRNTYEGGADERTLDGMIAEINWYAEEIISKSQK